MVTVEEAMRDLERSWAELRSAVEAVPEDEIAAPGVVEDWSVKDIVGHVAFWANRGAVTLQASNNSRFEDIPMGEGEGWVDQWNARESAARKDRSYKEIRGEWLKAHEAARASLASASDETLNAPFRSYTIAQLYAGDTYEHYAEHTVHITQWLREMETTEK